MKNKVWKNYIKMPIKDLFLWDENARFPEEYFKKSEKELISYFINDEKYRIEDLAKEIVEDFDMPQFEPLLVVRINDKNTVLEGNRRIAVYKLLANPFLTDNIRIQNVLLALNKRINIDDNFNLSVNVADNIEEAQRYIDRKHNKANNEVSWTSNERGHFAVRRNKGKNKDIFRVEMSKMVKKLDIPEEVKFAVLGKGYETTFWRIVGNLCMRKKLGYDISKSGNLIIADEIHFNKILKTIVYNVWKGKDLKDNPVNSRALNTAKQLEEYSESISEKDANKIDKNIQSEELTNLFGGKEIIKDRRSKSNPPSQNRIYLISSSIYIKDPRINDIYNELRTKLVVDDTPNAVAVLFRVFLECSVDHYIEKKKIKLNDNKLAGKILKSVNFLEEEKFDEYVKENNIIFPDIVKKKEEQEKKIRNKIKYKEIRKVSAKDNNSILSCSTFNDFIHDHRSHPIPSELKIYWNNLESFFLDLWRSANNSKK